MQREPQFLDTPQMSSQGTSGRPVEPEPVRADGPRARSCSASLFLSISLPFLFCFVLFLGGWVGKIHIHQALVIVDSRVDLTWFLSERYLALVWCLVHLSGGFVIPTIRDCGLEPSYGGMFSYPTFGGTGFPLSPDLGDRGT